MGDGVHWSEGSAGIKGTNRVAVENGARFTFSAWCCCCLLAGNSKQGSAQAALVSRQIGDVFQALLWTAWSDPGGETPCFHTAPTHPLPFSKEPLTLSSRCLSDQVEWLLCVGCSLAVGQVSEMQLQVFLCFLLPSLVSVSRRRPVTLRPTWNGSTDSAILWQRKSAW